MSPIDLRKELELPVTLELEFEKDVTPELIALLVNSRRSRDSNMVALKQPLWVASIVKIVLTTLLICSVLICSCYIILKKKKVSTTATIVDIRSSHIKSLIWR